MKYKLKSNKLEMVVDEMGAYVDSLDFQDIKIFFPKSTIKENGVDKVRGGSHPCFPHFGPASKVNLPQHGFARDEKWEVVESKEDIIVLKLENQYDEWKDVVAKITYKLEDDTFTTKLLVENNGDEDIFVTPGFHPYFTYENINEILLNNKKFELKKDLVDSYFVDGVKNFETSKYKLTFSTKNLDKFIIWTSFSDEFLCVEPSFNHKALDDGKELMKINSKDFEEFEYSIKIELK